MTDRSAFFYKKKQGRCTAALVNQLKQKATITHPFHPQYGKQYDLVNYKRSWGHECVDLHDDHDGLITVPKGWTNAVGPDAFVVVSAGRSHFRVENLIHLVHLIEGLQAESKAPGGKDGEVHRV